MLEDIAIVTGAQVISEELGRKLEDATIEDLGGAHRVVSDKDSTIIVDGKGKKDEIEARIGQIRSQIETTDSDYDKEKLQERLGKLSGGVAVIRVGAPSEVEQKESQHRIEDAVAATRAAIEEGIVPGGGVALVRAAKGVEEYIAKLGKNDVAEIVGAKIVLEALYAPVKQIAENAGYDGAVVLHKIISSGDDDYGFNAATGKFEKLMETGIVDPTKVTRSALQNAISIASMILITEAIVSDLPEKEGSSSGGGGGMPGGMPPGMGGMM